jgi:hypothetical protein
VKKIFIALAFCFCSLAMHGQKTRAGQDLPLARPGVDYPIKIHISGMHYRTSPYEAAIYADAVMNGKKVELEGGQGIPYKYYKLSPGDYQARLLKDSHKIADSPIFQEYEVILPDKTVWRCTLTGVLE